MSLSDDCEYLENNFLQPSWIQEQEKLLKVDSVFKNEPMHSIYAKFIILIKINILIKLFARQYL